MPENRFPGPSATNRFLRTWLTVLKTGLGVHHYADVGRNVARLDLLTSCRATGLWPARSIPHRKPVVGAFDGQQPVYDTEIVTHVTHF